MKKETKVWYYNSEHKSIKAISEVVSVPEGGFDIIKIIQIYANGAMDRYAFQDTGTETAKFFKDYNRVATEKQIEKCMLALNDALDFKVHQVSRWEN